MKEVIHFTHLELKDKFPNLKFKLTEKDINHILVKVTKGEISNSVSIGNIIHHYWHTYEPKVAKNVWFEVENHTMDQEGIISEIYQPDIKH